MGLISWMGEGLLVCAFGGIILSHGSLTRHSDHVSPPDHVPHVNEGHISNFSALVIGIDDYTGCPGLSGAVADANAINEYLIKRLGVPKDRIRMLRDDKATRKAIINAFQSLENDERIKKEDPILIFYSGHGGECYAPRNWGLGSKTKTQYLLPYDYKDKSIHPIPARTIGALIDDVARKKGNNITLVFDCCFSAGLARSDDEEYKPRAVDLDANIILEIKDLDKDILGRRGGEIPGGFTTDGLGSNILLAACGKNEVAYEREKHGLFTKALLDLLNERSINDLTYADVIEKICPKLDRQTPQCIGINQQRVLFDAKMPDVGRVRYPILDTSGNQFVISAGRAHGVSDGVEFTLYNQQRENLDIVKVGPGATIMDFQTTVTVSDVQLRNASFAELTRVGLVHLYLAEEERSSTVLEERAAIDPSVRLVQDHKEAKLEISMENSCAVFKILDPRTRRFGLKELPHRPPLDSVSSVLNAAARYYWYLDLTNGTGHKVIVDFYQLEEKEDEDLLSHRVPVGPGLCQKDPEDNLDVINLVADGKTQYGIKIENNTTRDLYLNAFLFNSSSLSIVPYRIQSTVGHPEPPLEKNGAVTIGYGPGGEPPFVYEVDEDQEVDIGYLKLFFATRPIDLSDVKQVSPFQDQSKEDKEMFEPREGLLPKANDVKDAWFTKTIPIVQRRKAVLVSS